MYETSDYECAGDEWIIRGHMQLRSIMEANYYGRWYQEMSLYLWANKSGTLPYKEMYLSQNGRSAIKGG